jgi:hypothetical protein
MKDGGTPVEDLQEALQLLAAIKREAARLAVPELVDLAERCTATVERAKNRIE